MSQLDFDVPRKAKESKEQKLEKQEQKVKKPRRGLSQIDSDIDTEDSEKKAEAEKKVRMMNTESLLKEFRSYSKGEKAN